MSEIAKLPVEVKAKTGESEKITINLGYVDLGSIDLLVRESFYANRTDFIRTAIRNLLDRHSETTRQTIARNKFDIGIRRFTRLDLEDVKAAGEVLNIHILGLASIANDVSPDLAVETIASLHVLGALDASPGVKAALGDRVK